MNKTQTLSRLWARTKVHRILLLISLALAAAGVVFALYLPVLVGNAIDLMIANGVNFSALFPVLLQIGLIALAEAVCAWVMALCNNRIVYRTVHALRTDAFAHLQHLPVSYPDTHPRGATVSRIMNDVDRVADGLLLGFSQLFTGVLTILGTLGFMLRLNPAITLVVVVITPLSLFVARFIATRTHRLFQAQSELRAEQTAFVEEMLSNQKVVRAFHHEEANCTAFAVQNEKLRACSLRALFFSSITNPSTRFVNSMVYAGVGLFGALAVIGGGLTVGGLSIFLSYASRYTKPFNEISGVITELQNALACATRVFDLLDTPEESSEEGCETVVDPEGQIAIEHVDFSYVPDRPLLQDVNVTARPGTRTAIVGPTGCGKTTLINLLMRFYEPDRGQILLDGTPLDRITRRSLRASYGMVLQDTWLKTATVAENIAFGKPDATREEIVAAAKAAHADGFIRRLPQGYDTVLTEDGSLSAGEKQLICIARLMLREPAMLILDEATSSIDTRTELQIRDAFTNLMQGRTTFIVAHRLQTIRDADLILVMRDGNIIQQGTHKELLARDGFYKTLYESRNG